MKLLFFIHAITGGGGERVLSTLVNELINRNYEVHVATRIDIPFAYEIDKRVLIHNLHRNFSGATSKFFKSIALRRNIRRISKEVKPDVIVAFMAALGCSVIFSTLGLGIPVVVSEHTNVRRSLSKSLILKRKLLYPFASAITVLTRHDLRLWQRKLRNVVYMPNPINHNSEIFNTPRRRVILAVGRVNQWHVKGFDNLIRCWGALCHDFPQWKLEIAGEFDISAKEYLDSIAAENNCINYEFLGFCKNVNEMMTTVEVFCLSSRVEGLPMALLEAMNSGCCCVSFDVTTGPREIIVNNTSGLLANDQDIADLTNKLRMVLENDNLRCCFASNAQASVERYSTERILNRWEMLFSKLLGK